MSRTRIIGGSLQEIVAGDYKMYSEADITNQSTGKVTQTGHSGGVKLGSPSRLGFGFIIPQCMVTFRPGKDYEKNPDYGFDWIRIGDTTQKGDNPFINVMGYRYKELAYNIKIKDNEGDFEPVMKLYKKKLDSFNTYYTFWENKSNPPLSNTKSEVNVNTKYCVPRLTLLPGKKASLRAILEVVESPSKITLEFTDPKASEYLKLSTNQISDIKTGVYDNSDELEIECIKEFSDAQILRVLADGMVCGAIKILPNDDRRIRKIDVYIINVRTSLNAKVEYVPGSKIPFTIGEKTGIPADGATEKLEKTLNQALIVPNIKTGITIDCTTPDFNQFSAHILGTNQVQVNNGGTFRKYLDQKLQEQYKEDIPDDAMRIYFIGENYPTNISVKGIPNGSRSGFAIVNSNFGVMFKSHDKSTVAHEMMHALGLAHTFDSEYKSAQYTYEIFKTNNIMDFNSAVNERICIYGWQWKILNPGILI